MTAQNTRWGLGASSLPPAVRKSTTREPESDDVTKKETTRSTPSSDAAAENGNASSMANIAVAMSFSTAPARSAPPPSSRFRAVPPNTDIHRKESNVGAATTPRIISRTDRPFEMRAMNMPTNGDQEIHHPQ